MNKITIEQQKYSIDGVFTVTCYSQFQQRAKICPFVQQCGRFEQLVIRDSKTKLL